MSPQAHLNTHTQRHFKVGGRKHSDPSIAHPQFAKFVRRGLVAPGTIDYSTAAAAILAMLLGNDAYGDCVEAAGYHIVGAETSNAGDPAPVTESWALADYTAITGFDPIDPSTDQGTDPASALAFWESTGFKDGTVLAGHVAVDASNQTSLKNAFYLCENLFLAMDLPAVWVAAIGTMKPGFVWDVAGAPVAENGHMVMAVGYTTSGLIICSWGMLGILTWGALAKYATTKGGGETYALLTPDQLGKAQSVAPNGLNYTALVAAFDGIGGDIPTPAPTPPTPSPAPSPAPAPPPKPTPPKPPKPTPPAPSPVASVTLADAQKWAVAGLAHGSSTVPRATAEAHVKASLAKYWPVSS